MSYNVIHERRLGVRLVPRVKIDAVEWDAANELHATRHGVSVTEIDVALAHAEVAHRNRRYRSGLRPIR